MENDFQFADGTHAGPRQGRACGGAGALALLPWLRRARFWTVSVALFAVFSLLLQPAVCALWSADGGRAERPRSPENAQLRIVNQPIAPVVAPDVLAERYGDDADCCDAERLTDDATPAPSNGASPHLHVPMPAYAMAILPVTLAVASAQWALQYDPPPTQARPYPARSARLLF